MSKAKIVETNEKIAKGVTEGYKKIEDAKKRMAEEATKHSSK